jgi:nitroreductase
MNIQAPHHSRPPLPDERLSARYGAPLAADTLQWNETLDILLDHRSSRHYLPKPLPAATVELLVAAAQSAPSSSNLQAWSVIAVEDPARKARLQALTDGNQHILTAPLLLVWLVDLKRLRDVAGQKNGNGEGLDYLESFLIGAVDAALAAQNAVVAAESLGLGTCYLGAIRNHPEAVSSELALPAETLALFGLTVGYPDPAVETAIKPRLPQSAVLHRETYRDTTPQDLAAYDERLQAFQRRQGLPETGWTSVVAARIGSVAALKGRSRLSDILRRLGFPIR